MLGRSGECFLRLGQVAGGLAAEVGELFDPDQGVDQVGTRVQLLVVDRLDRCEGAVGQVIRRTGVDFQVWR